MPQTIGFMKRSLVMAASGALSLSSSGRAEADVLAHWRFEEVQNLKGDRAPSQTGQPLTANDRNPTDPQPFAADESGNGNVLQSRGARPSPNVFSDNTPAPQADGKPNARSLLLKKGEYFVTTDRTLAFADMGKRWAITASVMTNLPQYDQVFLCKEGTRGSILADLSIGYDSMQQAFFVEVKDENGEVRRATADVRATAGKWYDLRAEADHDAATGKTTLRISANASGDTRFRRKVGTAEFKGLALPRAAAQWTLGRGFPAGSPSTTYVLDGAIDEIKIEGEPLPRAPGQNPLFTDNFTADPAALVVGDTVYVYTGHDVAKPGQFFVMPDWLCYSSKDMKTWTAHGPVLKPSDFSFGQPNSAWAAQVVERDGKFFYYVTVDRKNGPGHTVSVAVGDSPTGPFKDARGTPLITDDMTTDSRKSNADIDPTVLIDDDGTAWLAWGNGDCYFAKLKRNMIELDGPIQKISFTNYGEGPWLFKRNGLYYNVYAADVPGVSPEQIAYATAETITGPWTYRGLLTGPAQTGFTIHPAVFEFKGQWYFLYHDGSTTLNGVPGGDVRRSVCLEYVEFNEDGSMRLIKQTPRGVSVPPAAR